MNDCITVSEYPGGVAAVDSGLVRDRMACCYLLEADGAVAIVEAGGRSSVPRLMKALEARGRAPEEVAFVIVTHVHLDHAGGAGLLMRQLPSATLLAHPRGARHLVDPSRLEASARRVYGDEEFDRMYGTLVPVDEARVRVMEDGDAVEVGDRRLEFIDTPGHARHHFCVWDEATRGWFTGDTFGLSYREFDTGNGAFVFPTTTPIEFDPDALRASVGRLMERSPECMYLTHYGRVTDVPRLARDLLAGIDRLVEIARAANGREDRDAVLADDIRAWLVRRLEAHGVRMAPERRDALLEMDVQLNAAGVAFWLDRLAKAGG
jgi:glyoxylase-like metal-dependent hydrolase (beta-lactamase superfamily II)